MYRFMTSFIILAALSMLSVSVSAQEPPGTITFNFQGRLNNSAGQPVPDGNYQMRFFIYADSVGGTPLWTELHSAVPVAGGFFGLDLGSVVPCSLGIPSLDNIFVATQIGTAPPMPRRLRISTAPNSGVARRIYGDLESSPGALKFLDDGSEYMGVEPSPWNPGGSLKMYGASGAVSLEFASDGAASFLDDGSEYMGVEPSPWNPGGSLKMYGASGAVSLEFASDGSASFLDDGSEYMGIEPSPWNPGGSLKMYGASGAASLEIASDGSASFLDDGSEYMGVEPSPFHFGGDLVMRDATGAQTIILSSLGNISIGTSSISNILTVRQNATADPIADAWTVYSSRRWKTNIQPLQGSLDKVMRLNGVSFDWTEGGKHDIGLIAEDVGQVVPEVVAYEDNGVDAKSVDYARLVALLIEGMKEQQKTINELKSEINEIKAQINQ
jgi:hypothetical protein